jgi:hypothetical protein
MAKRREIERSKRSEKKEAIWGEEEEDIILYYFLE